MKFLKSLVSKTIIYAVFSALFLFPCSQAVSAQETPVFDRMKSAFEDGQIFRASFSHRYEDSFTGEVQENEGTIWIGKEQYKIEGNNQVMVVDDEISRVFDQNKNRVIVSDYVEEEDDFAPSRMLQGVDESYSVRESSTESGTEITLESDDPFSVFATVMIELDENERPLEIRATDQAENLLVTRFQSGEFTEAAEDLFNINAPDDAEVIDLRYSGQ